METPGQLSHEILPLLSPIQVTQGELFFKTIVIMYNILCIDEGIIGLHHTWILHSIIL